jgi:glycosyltransferase involved in cell wall biosynthesis
MKDYCLEKKRMRILWVCFCLLNDFRDEFGINKSYGGPWIASLLHQLEHNDDLEIGLCFPIIDKERMKDGKLNSHKYYSFNCSLYSKESINEIEKMTKRFEEIINDFKPEVIHIWGSELPHAYAAVQACENLSIINKVIVDIQGLYFVNVKHFYANIPNQYKKIYNDNFCSINENKNLRVEFSKFEIQLIKKINNVFGRTDWDKACVIQQNHSLSYYPANRILRDVFYGHIGKWDINNCIRNSIFISQGFYPLKGLHYLLQAMPTVFSMYPKTHIYVAGYTYKFQNEEVSSPYAIYLNDLINEFHLTDNITFLGSLTEEEMVKQYLQSHVYVSASSIENSSNSVSEAMLLGVPVVSSYVGGITNLLRDKTDGLLYQHDAPYMLAHYICQIFNDDELAASFSKNASENMRKIVDRKRNAEQIVKVYKMLAKMEIA